MPRAWLARRKNATLEFSGDRLTERFDDFGCLDSCPPPPALLASNHPGEKTCCDGKPSSWTGVLVLWALPLFADDVHWQRINLDKTFRSEGVAAFDVNHDGKIDVMAGDVWYEAPDWKMHEIRTAGKYDGSKGYSNSFCNFGYDVNGDGWVDLDLDRIPRRSLLLVRESQERAGPLEGTPDLAQRLQRDALLPRRHRRRQAVALDGLAARESGRLSADPAARPGRRQVDVLRAGAQGRPEAAGLGQRLAPVLSRHRRGRLQSRRPQRRDHPPRLVGGAAGPHAGPLDLSPLRDGADRQHRRHRVREHLGRRPRRRRRHGPDQQLGPLLRRLVVGEPRRQDLQAARDRQIVLADARAVRISTSTATARTTSSPASATSPTTATTRATTSRW